MRIAVTGGTGFVGRHLARSLAASGHTVVLISRGVDRRDISIRSLPGSRFFPIGLDDVDALASAFENCDAVAHCAGINRERGPQTYRKVHVDGTQNVIDAAIRSGVRKIVLVSFLRARQDPSLPYHHSKWLAEEIVRKSGLDYTVIKEGITYGQGDHMISHLSWALSTLPLFAYVGLHPRQVRPIAVQDLVRVIESSLINGRLSRETVAVVGPEEMTFEEAIRRVIETIGRRPFFMFRLPGWCHKLLAFVWETVMTEPLASRAQVRMLQEGLSEPMPPTAGLPADLLPQTRLTPEQIRGSLPVSR